MLCLELGRLATRPPRGLRYILVFFFNTILYSLLLRHTVGTIPYICPAPSVERRLLRIPAHIYAPGRRNARHASASTDQPGERLQRHPGKAARTRPAASPKKLKDGDAQQPRQPPAVGEPQPAVVGESIQGAGAGAGAEQWRGRARRLPRDPKGRRPGQRRGVGQSGRARVPPVDRPRRRLPVAPVPRPQVRRGRTS